MQPPESIYSVKSLLGELRARLENRFADLWVEGEISNLAKPASGHMYFSLKEDNVVIRCALFGGARRQFTATPCEGMQVLARGRISVYEPRGDLQFVVSYLEDAGEGALRRELEQRKRKLRAEGLFDAAHKKSLPAQPQTIGVITSPTGAALHDIRVTLGRRYPLAKLIVYPALVQGATAADTIAEMLRVANRRAECEVLIVARGGGSLEDLQAFNAEPVAREIFASRLPVVSAVGHEVDFTIADLVADIRAPTPTAAAEMVAPQAREMLTQTRECAAKLRLMMTRNLESHMQTVDYLSARAIHPARRLQLLRQSYQAARSALIYHMQGTLQRRRFLIQQQTAALQRYAPQAKLADLSQRLHHMRRQLQSAATARLAYGNRQLDQLAAALDLMHPRHTLARGYAILQDARDQIITAAAQTHSGQQLTAQVARGQFRCIVAPRERAAGRSKETIQAE